MAWLAGSIVVERSGDVDAGRFLSLTVDLAFDETESIVG
jgi:hypothetical protein